MTEYRTYATLASDKNTKATVTLAPAKPAKVAVGPLGEFDGGSHVSGGGRRETARSLGTNSSDAFAGRCSGNTGGSKMPGYTKMKNMFDELANNRQDYNQ